MLITFPKKRPKTLAAVLKILSFYQLNSMTTHVSDQVHLFTGWRDIPKDKPQSFHSKRSVVKYRINAEKAGKFKSSL